MGTKEIFLHRALVAEYCHQSLHLSRSTDALQQGHKEKHTLIYIKSHLKVKLMHQFK